MEKESSEVKMVDEKLEEDLRHRIKHHAPSHD
jgi:hypothetical protein